MSEPVTLDDIKSIIKLIREADNVAEFSLKYGELEISLSREGSGSSGARAAHAVASARPAAPEAETAAPAAKTASAAPDPAPAARSSGDPAPGADEIVVKAPMVGTFYRSPKPGEPPFVEVGSTVTPDSVLCIIEVMKLMNSLQAGVAGTVTRILAGDAQAVEYSQPLIYIRKSA